MRVFIIFSLLLFLSGLQNVKLTSHYEEYGIYKKRRTIRSDDQDK